MSAVHYAGALTWKTRDGYKHSVLPGWAACCSGDRAETIRNEGRNTFDAAAVTCKACRRCLALAHATGACPEAVSDFDKAPPKGALEGPRRQAVSALEEAVALVDELIAVAGSAIDSHPDMAIAKNLSIELTKLRVRRATFEQRLERRRENQAKLCWGCFGGGCEVCEARGVTGSNEPACRRDNQAKPRGDKS